MHTDLSDPFILTPAQQTHVALGIVANKHRFGAAATPDELVMQSAAALYEALLTIVTTSIANGSDPVEQVRISALQWFVDLLCDALQDPDGQKPALN